MSLVEQRFPQKMDKPKPEVGADTVKKVGKKSFFQGEKQQNLFICISRLPPAANVLEAVDRLNDKAVSTDNL